MAMQAFRLLGGSLLLALQAACSSVMATGNGNGEFLQNPQAREFIDSMVRTHGMDRAQLEDVFSKAERREDILELMRKPAEKRLKWFEYREIFLTRARIEGGVRFWRDNADILDQVALEYGVDPQIVVAIIGVETRYGANTGRHRVIDALATLAFDYPPRSKFFTGELEQYLLLARDEHIDLLATTGSYAGAMGYGQFIPSSYRHYAVDYDGDEVRNLWDSKPDIIASVANYFHEHGWQPGQPVAVRADVGERAVDELLQLGYEPQTEVSALRGYGIKPHVELPDSLPAALLSFDQPESAEYWLGFRNFYVITRYNRSPLYAMAVYQLSEEIRNAYDRNQALHDPEQ